MYRVKIEQATNKRMSNTVFKGNTPAWFELYTKGPFNGYYYAPTIKDVVDVFAAYTDSSRYGMFGITELSVELDTKGQRTIHLRVDPSTRSFRYTSVRNGYTLRRRTRRTILEDLAEFIGDLQTSTLWFEHQVTGIAQVSVTINNSAGKFSDAIRLRPI
jgi:hypothetical protein